MNIVLDINAAPVCKFNLKTKQNASCQIKSRFVSTWNVSNHDVSSFCF